MLPLQRVCIVGKTYLGRVTGSNAGEGFPPISALLLTPSIPEWGGRSHHFCVGIKSFALGRREADLVTE